LSILFEPLQIGRIQVRNRVVRSATYYGLADANGFASEASVGLMRTLARNSVGLIITGYAFVRRDGQCFADMNGIDRDEQIPGYLAMTNAVHELGGHVVMQIAHGGSAANQVRRRGEARLCVSLTDELASDGMPFREMNDGDILEIIEAFSDAARRVQEAGFDGVQIHGAHGYLGSQFLSPHSNRRQDRWGGSLENRMRFVIEVTRAIRNKVDDDFPVMIKLGCRDYLDQGTGTTIEEGAKVAAALEREGLCLVEVSNGLAGPSFAKVSRGSEAVPIREAYMLDDATVVRKATALPLCLVGGMRSPAMMESVIESGTADCISLCRPLIREPDLIGRWRDGDRRPAECISCRSCLRTNRDGTSRVRCRQIDAV
jgi:2,4-dienoyl-CoA reductase-like NADH-dependent reductase (Old Yellow Enzyme family)